VRKSVVMSSQKWRINVVSMSAREAAKEADINVKIFLQRDEFQSAVNCPEVLSGNWVAGTNRNRAILPTQSNRNHRALPCCQKA
jgi:hypothetical protein